jgi:hypothetical protein
MRRPAASEVAMGRLTSSTLLNYCQAAGMFDRCAIEAKNRFAEFMDQLDQLPSVEHGDNQVDTLSAV